MSHTLPIVDSEGCQIAVDGVPQVFTLEPGTLAAGTDTLHLGLTQMPEFPDGTLAIVDLRVIKRNRCERKERNELKDVPTAAGQKVPVQNDYQMKELEKVKADTKRSANFTQEEIEVLVEEVAANSTVLFGKFSATNTLVRKNIVWEAVTRRVNSMSQVVRESKNIKKKWQDTSSQIKKKESERRREMRKTGGGSVEESHFSDWEMKVLEVIGVEAVEGIEGGFDVGGFDVGLVEDVGLNAELNGKVNKEMVDYMVGSGTDVKVEQGKSYVNANIVKERMKVEKKAGKLGGHDRIVEIEERRLEIEEEMLKIKRRRLEIEEERLKKEMRRNEL